MQTLTAADVLALWERGAALHAIDRALETLAAALPERSRDDLARLTLGARDALLLALRGALLGDRIAAQDVCPDCGERVEVELLCSRLADAGGAPPGEWSMSCGPYALTLRPLDSRDAALAAQCADVASARAALLARSIVAAACGGEPVAVGALPGDVASAVAESIAARDAAAELSLAFRCPGCSHEWSNILDVATFVWTELSARAQRLLLDVDMIARAYHWREADILALSDARRAAYVALVTA